MLGYHSPTKSPPSHYQWCTGIPQPRQIGLNTSDRGGGKREVNHQGVSQLKVLYSRVNKNYTVGDVLALAVQPTVNICLVFLFSLQICL